MILGAQFNYNTNKYKAQSNNKRAHITNGNIFKSGHFKCLHVNKGNSNFENSLDKIYHILDTHKPDIFSINEANYDIGSNTIIGGYKIEAKSLVKGHNIARTIVLIRDCVNYKRKTDFENDYISSLWIEIQLSSKKSIYFMSSYRQWSLPSDLMIDNSGSKTNQIHRYNTIIGQIEFHEIWS